MSDEVQAKPVEVKTGLDDVFVIMLLPELPAFDMPKPLEIRICGRSILKWSLRAIEDLPHARVPALKTDDILTLVRKHAEEHKYTVVLYADTPLMTTNTIEQAVAFVRTFGHKAARMPRGWVFETEHVKKAESVIAEDVPNLSPEDFIVAYNHAQVALIGTLMRQRINIGHLGAGVQIIDPATTFIDAAVEIDRGVVIEPNTYLIGDCKIAGNVKIFTGSRVVDSEIGEGTIIGPYAHLREGNCVGKNCRITNFVELKKSVVGDGSKIAHMSYVGDAEIGKNCNLGCGVIFCNYDGKVKSKSVIGDKVFIGSNSNIIAPVRLEDCAYVAAGSTITQDVPTKALAIARVRQAIKENWNKDSEEE